MSGARWIRAAVGVVVVMALGFVVMNWWNDYKSAAATKKVAAVIATATPSSAPAAAVAGIGVARIDGVNFRTKPSSSAKLIRGLKKGEKVTVLLQEGSWYKVKDSKGKTGWVTANGDYVVLTEN